MLVKGVYHFCYRRWERHGLLLSVWVNACVHVRRARTVVKCEGIRMCACEKGMVYFSVWGNMYLCMWEEHGIFFSVRENACVHVRRAWIIIKHEGACMCACEKGMEHGTKSSECWYVVVQPLEGAFSFLFKLGIKGVVELIVKCQGECM